MRSSGFKVFLMAGPFLVTSAHLVRIRSIAFDITPLGTRLRLRSRNGLVGDFPGSLPRDVKNFSGLRRGIDPKNSHNQRPADVREFPARFVPEIKGRAGSRA